MESLEVAAEEPVEEEEVVEKGKEKKTKAAHKIGVASMCMNSAGNLIYAGCTDNIIRVFEIVEKKA
jgi:hypothetical protein